MKPKIITTLADYGWSDFRGDALAGVTVALVALPLSIAIAIASGAPPFAGIITAIIGGFLISALGGSRVQIGGPTGAFIVLVYGIVASHGLGGLVVATGMAGIILLIAGFLRAGRLISLVPEPVVDGFTIGIAIVIATNQLKDFLGMTTEKLPADFLAKLPVLWAARHTVNIPATAIGVVTLVALVVVRRRWPRIPGPLLVLAAVSGAAILWGEPIATVKGSFGTLPAGIGWPQIPHVTWQMALDLLPAALAIALLAGIESLLSAVVADRMIGGRYRHGAELIAQGAANVGSALFGGLPATGAIARTATNIAAGGRTPVAGMIHAIVIWILVALAGDLVGWLILPGLAALLILTAWNMSEPHRWPDRLGRPWRHIIVILLTATLTLLVDLIVAIGVSTLVAFALGIRAERVPETE